MQANGCTHNAIIMSELTSVGFTKDEWRSMYKEYKPKFEWFILKYYGPAMIHDLDDLVKQEDGVRCPVERMITILNDIWFDLPDHIFNIMENPPGWSEFLRLIEP